LTLTLLLLLSFGFSSSARDSDGLCLLGLVVDAEGGGMGGA